MQVWDITVSCRSTLALCCINLSTTSTCLFIDATISEHFLVLANACITKSMFGREKQSLFRLRYVNYSVSTIFPNATGQLRNYATYGELCIH